MAAQVIQAEGTSLFKGQGIEYTVKAVLTFKADTITTLHFSSETVKISKTITQAIISLAEGKKVLDAVKITSQAVQSHAKSGAQHLVETVTAAFHASLRNYHNRQRGKEPFEELYEEVNNYYEGCTLPSLNEFSECSCGSHSTDKH